MFGQKVAKLIKVPGEIRCLKLSRKIQDHNVCLRLLLSASRQQPVTPSVRGCGRKSEAEKSNRVATGTEPQPEESLHREEIDLLGKGKLSSPFMKPESTYIHGVGSLWKLRSWDAKGRMQAQHHQSVRIQLWNEPAWRHRYRSCAPPTRQRASTTCLAKDMGTAQVLLPTPPCSHHGSQAASALQLQWVSW